MYLECSKSYSCLSLKGASIFFGKQCFVSLYLVLVVNKYSVACFRKTFVDCCKIPGTSNMVGCCDIKYGNKELPTKAY